MTLTEKVEEVERIAETVYSQSADWVTFFREILGKDGAVRHTFPTRESMAEFEQSETYRKIRQMLRTLRDNGPAANGEATKVITVRLPASLHAALQEEAHDLRTSVNKLCITRLLQIAEEEDETPEGL